jgi:hypothetical protein
MARKSTALARGAGKPDQLSMSSMTGHRKPMSRKNKTKNDVKSLERQIRLYGKLLNKIDPNSPQW